MTTQTTDLNHKVDSNLPTQLITKVRSLPKSGIIDVQIGETVTANDILGKTSVQGDLHIVRLAELLETTPKDLAGKLKIEIGQQIAVGDLVVSYKTFFGLFKTEYVSEHSGTIEFIHEDTAHIGIRQSPKEQDLTAYISGKVSSIQDNRTVEIVTDAYFIQGIFGVGGEKVGKLWYLDFPTDYEIQKDDIPRDISSHILAGGMSFSSQAIEVATKRGAIGIITGSIKDNVLTEYLGYPIGIALTGNENVPATLIITEGFGDLSMNDLVQAKLKESNGKLVSINGATQVRAGAIRPEVIIPITKKTEKATEELNAVIEEATDKKDENTTNAEQSINQQKTELKKLVRIVKEPYFGAIGEIVSEPKEPQLIETGAILRVVEVKLTKNKGKETSVFVPRANVESLEG